MPSAVKAASAPAPDWFKSDAKFNLLFPAAMQTLANSHWTPLSVARLAAEFLAAERNVKVLDIGSGIGKFCLAAAHFKPAAFYTGVEQRQDLVSYAEGAKAKLALSNVKFIHGNFTSINFNSYDHFYFYNSFYENFAFTAPIDNSVQYSGELYHQYASYLLVQLAKKPAGTRLATFHSLEDEVPEGFLVVGTAMDNDLKFWIKI